MRLMRYCIFLVVICCGAARHPGGGTVVIVFKPQFAGVPLQPGAGLYHNSYGDSFYVDVLRFYVSSLNLQGPGKHTYYDKKQAFLIDIGPEGKQTITLEQVPAGWYQQLTFDIGTDSLTNVSGAMGGDLDPTLGMYWAWNSGYINVKLEGRSNSCHTFQHRFEFHLGGYMPPNPTLRRISLPQRKIQVHQQSGATIEVIIDLAKFFDKIQLTNVNQVMIPSKQASDMSDNFKEVFGWQ